MTRSLSRDPLDHLSRSDKRAWRAAERRARHDHDRVQMDELQSLVATGVGITGLTDVDIAQAITQMTTPVEMIIDGRRVRAGGVARRSLATLREALSSMAAVPLKTVGRYGPYWVLTFKLATEQLVVLVEQLTLMPEWGGAGGREASPLGPLASLGV